MNMYSLSKIILLVLLIAPLTGCIANHSTQTPEFKNTIIQSPKNKLSVYRVKNHETIFSIAKNFKVDPREIVKINNLASNQTLRKGQTIKIPVLLNNKSTTEDKPISLIFPLKGKIYATFGKQKNGKINDCVYLKGNSQNVKASAAGRIEYIGHKISNIGNIIIIKHTNNWYTTYSNIGTISAEVGAQASQGQVIGTTGNNPLCFGLRKNSVSIDPIQFLIRNKKGKND